MIALALMPRRPMRTIAPVLPTESGVRDGLAYTIWLPAGDAPRGGVLILHGAGSAKESHYDFARAAVATRLAAVAFDQRGHGASQGRLDGRVLDDVVAMSEVLRTALASDDLPIAVRGSSLGGYLAILAAPRIGAGAVVAICPASAEGLLRGLGSEELGFAADRSALSRFLIAHDLHQATAGLEAPLLLLHAEGDERVPVQHSRELAEVASAPGSRLITVPGGHHRSVQHDPELRAISLRFIERALRDEPGR